MPSEVDDPVEGMGFALHGAAELARREEFYLYAGIWVANWKRAQA